MKKVLKHLRRAQGELAKADCLISPRTPGRDDVSPWLHITQTYLEAALLGAEAANHRGTETQRAAGGTG